MSRMENDSASSNPLVERLPTLPFTLRQLEYFLAVAEHGSISAAAEALHASDSAISDSITALERSVSAKLFNRQRSRGAKLTSDGIAIVPIARRIMADGAVLAASVGGSVSSLTGPVRLGFNGVLASLFLPRLILDIQEDHPSVHLDFRTGDLEDLLNACDSGELDFIVTYNLDMRPEYARRVLTHTQAMVVISAEHPLAGRKRISLAELADEPMVLMDITASRVHTLELMLNQGITPRIAYRTTDYELCRSLVGRGIGYSLLMRRNIPMETWDGSTVRYLPIHPSPREVEILAAWPEGPVAPRVSAVIDAVERIGAQITATRQA